MKTYSIKQTSYCLTDNRSARDSYQIRYEGVSICIGQRWDLEQLRTTDYLETAPLCLIDGI